MRIIITGGTGYIGGYLADLLAQDSHEITVLTRNPDKVRHQKPNIRYERWDTHTTEGWGHLVDGAQAILNFAAENIAGDNFFPARWTQKRKQRILESRVQAGKVIGAAIQDARIKPQLLIQASAIGYYGSDETHTFVESDPAGEDFQAQVCVAWEKSVSDVTAMGVRLIVVRTGLVISADDRSVLTRLLFPFRLFAGGPIGNGRQWLSWIHQVDYGNAIKFLLNSKNSEGPFNLTAPNPVQNSEFASITGRAMGRPSFIPAPALAFQLAFGEVATLVTDGVRVLPQRLLSQNFEFQYPHFQQALNSILGK